jgi:CheY-like chemotaxis protein
MMDFDESKMQHILINILTNAIKFTPRHGNVKVISEVAEGDQGPMLKLAVKDTGRGIPEDQLPHIFDRFYQVDNSATRYGEGSGIGLALVKELVQLLDGQIEVQSSVQKGTVVTVDLPIRLHADIEPDTSGYSALLIRSIETQGPEYTSAENNVDTEVTTDSDRPVVLVIEDNADVIEYIVLCLEQEYTLLTARNGKEGVDMALANIPDVVLCDVMMPEMDGFTVCRTLKTDRRTSHIPIILLTAKATQEDKVTGLTHGADAYLTKPFDVEELLVRLENLSALSKRLQERLADPDATHDDVDEITTRESAFLSEIRAIIRSHMSNELFDTSWLCREIAMSRTQLHRKLKALTGQPTANFIRSIRLSHARHLLETTDLPIGEIATRIGFKDFSHFSRAFAKTFGTTPSETRK